MRNCRLLNLPPELPNKIYFQVLVQEAPIQISKRSSEPSAAAQGTTLEYDRLVEPAFLRTCRQIRHEALPIFYGENVFFTAVKDAIAPWLLAIGPEKAKLVRCVRGFRPSRYFNYVWTRNLAGAVDKDLVKAGCGLSSNVFRMPFGHEQYPGKVFWTSGASDLVLVSDEGRIEHARGTCRVSKSLDGAVHLVPSRSLDE